MSDGQTVFFVGTDGERAVLCERCVIANTPWRRLRGLLGRRTLAGNEGLLLRPSASVHMFFMRFAIDAVFLDRNGVVVGITPGLRPWRVAARRGAKAVLELAHGETRRRGLEPGMRVVIRAAGDGHGVD